MPFLCTGSNKVGGRKGTYYATVVGPDRTKIKAGATGCPPVCGVRVCCLNKSGVLELEIKYPRLWDRLFFVISYVFRCLKDFVCF